MSARAPARAVAVGARMRTWILLLAFSAGLAWGAERGKVEEAVVAFQAVFATAVPASFPPAGATALSAPERDQRMVRLQIDALARDVRVAAVLASDAARQQSPDQQQRRAQEAMHTVTKLEASGKQQLERLAAKQTAVPAEEILRVGGRMIAALREHVDALGVSAMVPPPPTGTASGSPMAALPAGECFTIEEFRTLPADEIERRLTSLHPAAFYQYAGVLFEQGKKDAAVQWFYVGQLRYRFLLQAVPAKDPSGDPALFSSLNATVGQAINEYAGGDPQRWAASIQQALAWDAANPNLYTSKEQFPAVLDTVRPGAEKLKESILAQADRIRAERTKRGLENR
jgi:hypothetical protein